ncbi:hypothetical protein [Halioxenophilus sp. WMMB6]|uniref:hypothetical protein n=1 Tax=Halioxenophilus sp. WMMB6 TaxID=3073815 RepID=UPI00295E8B72|nr:hypothetical protein [Halioxenophilus sp. WMMB6]
MDVVIAFAIDALISGAILWLAAKLTKVDLAFITAVMVAGASALVGIIPSVGWLLSIIVFFLLLKQYTQAAIWPDLILMVLVSKLVALVAVFALAGMVSA